MPEIYSENCLLLNLFLFRGEEKTFFGISPPKTANMNKIFMNNM